MFPISAADSVSPAIQRTRKFLFRPFSWGTYLKLGLVAIITEGIGNNFRSSQHGGHPAGNGPTGIPTFHLAAEWIAVIVAAALVVLVYRGMIAPLRLQLTETRAEVARQEKLASLGVLAAGVAHEIRNPLTAIKFRLFSLKNTLPQPWPKTRTPS